METSSNRQSQQKKHNYSPVTRKKEVAEECPIEKVFGIELLLEGILEKLKPRDLKESRQVNKEWHYRSTKILLRTQSLKATLTFERNRDNTSQLIELTETMETSRKLNLPFPCRHLVCHKCDLSNRTFEHLLSKFGHTIQSLDISFGYYDWQFPANRSSFLRRFIHIFLDQLPNLETLTIASEYFYIWGTEIEIHEIVERSYPKGSSSKSACHPKLKSLLVRSNLPSHVFEFLIQAGVKIQNIDLGRSFPLNNNNLIDVLLRTNKTHLLTSTFIFILQNNLDIIDHLGNKANLNIKVLNLILSQYSRSRNYYLRVSNAVTRLLQVCSYTLVIFKSFPLSLFLKFQVPIMPRLEILSIRVPASRPHTFRPTKMFKISQVFPRLSMITLRHQCRFSSIKAEELVLNDFLGADYEDTVSSVENLEFNLFRKVPELCCIQALPRLFTNLKTIKIWNLANIPQVLEALWDLPVIEFVFFGISIQTLNALQHKCRNTNAFTALDSALTGISQETCDTISGKLDDIDETAIKNLRVNNSMLDAKSLRQILIRIDDNCIKKRTSPTKTILSKIARKYAFEMCPQVKVGFILLTHHQDNLRYLIDGVSPVVNTWKRMTEKKASNTDYEYYLPQFHPNQLSTSFAQRLAIFTT